jgi:serine/threonine protein kinase
MMKWKRRMPELSPVPAVPESRYTDAVTTGSESALVAGFRVIRKLDSSPRADIYLGCGEHQRGRREAEATNSVPGVALKVFSPDVASASVERELTALSRIARGQLPTLIDVAALRDGRPVFVLERLTGGTLATYLRMRERITPGEAVTILAPVVVALRSLHDAGFSHANLGQSSILLDETGRPVLAGLGGLVDLPQYGFATLTGLSRMDLIRDDHTRLTELIRSVFHHLGRDEPLARTAEIIAARFEMWTLAVPFRPCLDDLERALFQWSSAAPLGPLGAERQLRAASARAVPGRVALDTGGPGGMPVLAPEAAGSGTAAIEGEVESCSPVKPPFAAVKSGLDVWLQLFHVPPEFVSGFLQGGRVSPLAGLGATVRKRVVAHRAPVIVSGCLAAAVTVLALTLLPPVSSGGVPVSEAGQDARDQFGSGADREAPPAGAGGGEASDPVDSARRAGAGELDGGEIAAGDSPPVVRGEDPVSAAAELLRRRARCLAGASVICLDSVDQAGSSILAADSYSVRLMQQGAEAPTAPGYEAYEGRLIERIGNSALVELKHPGEAQREPASLLLVKGEAGWRLREVFDY